MLNTTQHTSGPTCQFKFEWLKQITNNFSKDRIIGSGAYGVVYKGVKEDGQEIAVKKLIDMPLDHDSENKFHNECINLLRVRHENIVRLIGYCDETHRPCVQHEGKHVFVDKNDRALCFEYFQRGSLDKHISDKPCRLDWDQCYKIIKGVCKGLHHLQKCSIFHLDIKPANILLDNSMMAKIGDFGLSRLYSSTKTSVTTTILGTPGYTPPEYVDKKEISPKYDVFSMGVLIIHIMAGRRQYNAHFGSPSTIIELVCEQWKERMHKTMWSRASQEVRICIEIALRCVKSNRHERPTISRIVDDLNRIDTSNLSFRDESANIQSGEDLICNQYTNSVSMGMHKNATGFTSVESIDYKHAMSNEVEVGDRSMHEPMDYVHESNNCITRVEGNIHSPVIMDTIGNLFRWARSNTPSQWSGGTLKNVLDDELSFLEKSLQCLMETLPTMYDLIDRAEWRIHKHPVAKLLPNLKDAVYDADDIIDEFRWYMLKVNVERNGSQSTAIDFFNGVSKGNFTMLVNGIRDRLHNISTHLQDMGLQEVKRFDRSVRPQTSSFPDETRLFGRDMELNSIIEFICKSMNSSSANPKHQIGNSAVDVQKSTSASNQVISGSRTSNLIVLPIVGIGGVGKTTLAQHICSNAQVKSHFDMIIWVCVSDDFDVKRLTKEAIVSCLGKQTPTENLNYLQGVLSGIASSKKLLIVLDDMWDDVLNDNAHRWTKFCAPLKNVIHGSVMLVTTRFQKVAGRVGTRDPVTLEGLKDDVFWNFFKLRVFESGNSNNNDPELERIAKSIVPKLKGSPLAAKTLGQILRINLQAECWNAILESELWNLRKEETEIFPALRLSYVHLPFRLKRCFSLCAMYPKHYKFQKSYMAEIWVAEGFVEPERDIPIQDTSCEYFDELLYRSFFQEDQGEYVIHDLLHEMAQKISEFDCFIIKRRSEFKYIPPNVRHLSILSSTDIDYSSLSDLCHFTKLRTLLCSKPLANKKTPASLMEAWFREFRRLRVIVLATTHELPASIGNLKHLRYLQIFRACPFKSLPAEFCWLYNLQIVRFEKCKLESLPTDFSKLICLQRFEARGFLYDSMFARFQAEEFYCKVSIDAANGEQGLGFRLIKNIDQLSELVINNIGKPISKEIAAEAQLRNKKYLEKLILKWSLLRNLEDNDIEVLRFLQPPACLKSVLLHGYPGMLLPNWFQPEKFPTVMSSLFISCDGLESSSVPWITDLIIDGCENLSSLEHVIHPAYILALKKLAIKNCKKLVFVPTERFGDFRCLEEFEVHGCPNINSQILVAPSLKRLVLGDGMIHESNYQSCGNLADNVDCSSLTYFFLSCDCLTSIQLQKWNLPALEELHISGCPSLTSIIGQSGQVTGASFLSRQPIEEKQSVLLAMPCQTLFPKFYSVHHCISGPYLCFGSRTAGVGVHVAAHVVEEEAADVGEEEVVGEEVAGHATARRA